MRSDENAEYDRQKANDYLARLKDAVAKDSSNPSRPSVMSRDVAKPDRTHVEIVEVPEADIALHEMQGFTKA